MKPDFSTAYREGDASAKASLALLLAKAMTICARDCYPDEADGLVAINEVQHRLLSQAVSLRLGGGALAFPGDSLLAAIDEYGVRGPKEAKRLQAGLTEAMRLWRLNPA